MVYKVKVRNGHHMFIRGKIVRSLYTIGGYSRTAVESTPICCFVYTRACFFVRPYFFPHTFAFLCSPLFFLYKNEAYGKEIIWFMLLLTNKNQSHFYHNLNFQHNLLCTFFLTKNLQCDSFFKVLSCLDIMEFQTNYSFRYFKTIRTFNGVCDVWRVICYMVMRDL